MSRTLRMIGRLARRKKSAPVALAEVSLKALFAEVTARGKCEFTPEDFTEKFWDFIEISEEKAKEIIEEYGLEVATPDEMQEERDDAEVCFELLTRLAYLPKLTTIRDLQALQAEARHELQKQGQHQGILIR